MAQRFERIFRNRKLTPEEIARDEEVRRRVQKEFPPAGRAFTSGPFRDTLKQAILAIGKSVAQLADDSGIAPIVVSRFLCGESDIHMATADKLAETLGLKLPAVS